MTGYTCRICGKYHDGLPIRYGAAAPASWFLIPENERKKRAKLSSDLCEIDHADFFILGNIDIPIIDSDQVFSWSVWVSLSADNFARACKLWNKKGRESESPYFGWLNTLLPTYPNTLNLKTNVHTRQVGTCPLIELEHTDHPLAIEQRQGITWDRIQEIAEAVLHEDPS